MNIFFNISHPAHVHLFKNVINNLKKKNHNVVVGARDKEITLQLLHAYKMDFILLTKKGNGVLGLITELMIQQFNIAKIIRKYKIDLMIQLNGIFNAPVGRLFNIPTIAFSDTENAKLDNAIAFPLTKHVFLTSCFDHDKGGTWKKQIHYPGYHELAYLSPKYFRQNIKKNGKKFLVRFVGWKAGHDIGEKSLTLDQKEYLVDILKNHGKVFISSESPLPKSLAQYLFPLNPVEIHEFMTKCDLVIGESATMASEAACLGVPAVYISDTGRGYTTEQDQKYGLLKHFKINQWDGIVSTIQKWAASDLCEEWQEKKSKMLADKIEVTDWLTDLFDGYPESIKTAKNRNLQKYKIVQK